MAIRDATVDDANRIAQILREAFGGEAEAALVAALRREGYAVLELVALRDGEIVGHLMLSRLSILVAGGVRIGGVALAPVAVAIAWQGRGIGSALVRAALARATTAGERIVLVLGEPEYYGRFGFSAAAAARLDSHYAGPAFQAIGLRPDALDGVAGNVEYPPPFAGL